MANKNYNRIYSEEKKQMIEKPIVKEVKKPEVKIGIVCNCNTLNVRKEPSKYADILCTIQASEKVEIDESKSTHDFYKIFNSAGVEGYCMKNYISVDR